MRHTSICKHSITTIKFHFQIENNEINGEVTVLGTTHSHTLVQVEGEADAIMMSATQDVIDKLKSAEKAKIVYLDTTREIIKVSTNFHTLHYN